MDLPKQSFTEDLTVAVHQGEKGGFYQLYVVPYISEDMKFKPDCREEIRTVQWHDISEVQARFEE